MVDCGLAYVCERPSVARSNALPARKLEVKILGRGSRTEAIGGGGAANWIERPLPWTSERLGLGLGLELGVEVRAYCASR